MACRIATALTCLVAAALPALARAGDGDLMRRLAVDADGGPPCYARSYGQMHLASHPRQSVESFAITMGQASESTAEGSHRLLFAIKLKGRQEWYTNGGYCMPEKEQFSCHLEGDGGHATISTSGARGLRLETGPDGIGLAGPSGLVAVGGEASDDRVFILHPTSRSVCLAATGEQAEAR